MRMLIYILCMCLLPGLVAASAGRILYVSGKVSVERDGHLYRAVKFARLKQGDVIETRDDGRLHMRMSDRTLISLKPSSRFEITEYRFSEDKLVKPSAQRSSNSVAATPSDDRSVFSLLKGGFRAITGLIGKNDKSAFGVNTPVAVIGIRGTSFVAELEPPVSPAVASRAVDGLLLAYAEQDLPELGGAVLSDYPSTFNLAQAGGNLGGGMGKATLTVGVGSGAVVLRNNGGQLLLENGEFGVVRGADEAPKRLVTPVVDSEVKQPPAKEDDDDDNEEDKTESPEQQQSSSTSTRTVSTESTSEQQQEPIETEEEQTVDEDSEYFIAFGIRKDIASSSYIANLSRPTQVGTVATALLEEDSHGNATSFFAEANSSETAASPELVNLELINGNVVNAGIDDATGLQWGRWSGGSIQMNFANGSQQLIEVSDSVNVHIIQSASHDAEVVLPASGTAQFVLRGNTDPTDNLGNQGFLGNATLTANFDLATVDSSLSLSLNEELWTASGTGVFGGTADTQHMFSGAYGQVSVAGQRTGQGEFSGFMTGQAAAAGLSYQLDDGNQVVNGTAAFVQVNPGGN